MSRVRPKQAIYLDYAATTPLHSEVRRAMEPYLTEHFYNPSSPYAAAQGVKKDVEAARRIVAGWLGAKPSEIVFTAGGTEANNLAIHGVMNRFPDANAVVSAIEHESVLEPAERHRCKILPVGDDGRIELNMLEKAIDESTVLVNIMYANNEIGTIQPLPQIAAVVKEVRRRRQNNGNRLPLYLHTDAAQAAAHLDLHVDRLGVDLMMLNGSKIYGPKQVGCLYVKTGTFIESILQGGGQERNLRSGTENVAGIIGFAAALDRVQRSRRQTAKHEIELRDGILNQITRALPEVKVNGSLRHRLPSNLNVTFPGIDGERLVLELDEQGVQVATGSACSANNDTRSHVLSAIGLSDEAIDGSLRITVGELTSKAQAIKAAQTIIATVKSMHRVAK